VTAPDLGPHCPTCQCPARTPTPYVPVIGLAAELGVSQRHVLRVIVRLGIRRHRMRLGRHPRRATVVRFADAVHIAAALIRPEPVKPFQRILSPRTFTTDKDHPSVKP
jgi:hypothetical protein